MPRRLPRSFYRRPAPVVAQELLGKILVRVLSGDLLRGRIVETEAYTGETDPGSHAFRGRTPRNAVMWGPPGHVYVYVSYGMHHCMNVVTEQPGVAGAVLLRALEPLSGLPRMESNRRGKPLIELCNGPGKLCQAFGITLADNGADLEGATMWIEDDGFQLGAVEATTRVGLSNGRDMPLRYLIAGNPFVSRGKPSGTPLPVTAHIPRGNRRSN